MKGRECRTNTSHSGTAVAILMLIVDDIFIIYKIRYNVLLIILTLYFYIRQNKFQSKYYQGLKNKRSFHRTNRTEQSCMVLPS